MTERYNHSNPWAEKLQDIRVPEINGAWDAMEALLDQEMPVQKWKDWRRWLLLIILLLLLIGVCNCPGRGRFSTGSHSVMRDPGGGLSGGTDTGRGIAGGAEPDGRSGRDISGEGSQDEEEVRRVDEVQGTGVPGELPDDLVKRKSRRSLLGRQAKDGASAGRPEKQGVIAERSEKHGVIPAGPEKQRAPAVRSEKQGVIPGGSLEREDTLTKTGKTAPPPRQKEEKSDTVTDVKGWMAGIGLNQFFTVGGQQRSDYNSSGTTGGLSDYIPVPMIRYYFSRKLFMQMEAQFNTPQYIKGDLVGEKSQVDTTIPNVKKQSVLFIKKLFYFNVPLSIHYSPVKDLYIGAGIQFSQLTNGVGVTQNKLLSAAGTDSTIVSTKIANIKNDSVYRKMRTNEFRLLLDLDYTYKRVILGVRYNQALSKFLNVRISDTEISQARNSSLQIYLRYILWDGRKKKLFTK